MKTTKYPCGCVLGPRDPVRLCEKAKALLERVIAERDDLFDAGLGGSDQIPGNAAFRLEQHWSDPKCPGRRKTAANKEPGETLF